jgi:hypothetical protein
MKQYNVKNIALALVLVGASSGTLASTAAPAAGGARPSWAREHAKTLFAGVSATAILGFAVYTTIQVKRIDKKLNAFKSTPRSNKALALRADRENWVFLRNIAWGALVVAGGLTAVGTVHHLTKDQAWAQKSDANWLAKIGQMVLGHKPTEKPLITPGSGTSTPGAGRSRSRAGSGAAGGTGAGSGTGHGLGGPTPGSGSPVRSRTGSGAAGGTGAGAGLGSGSSAPDSGSPAGLDGPDLQDPVDLSGDPAPARPSATGTTTPVNVADDHTPADATPAAPVADGADGAGEQSGSGSDSD